jgi:predicted anti-sigma-YlaC factor YlaD
MKKANENFSTQCDEVERLLVKKDVDGLTSQENLLLKDHLKSCERCRSYQSALLNVRDSVQIDSEEKLIPDPAIRRNILRSMNALKQKETPVLTSWRHVRSILAYRIPIYQTLAGVALIFLISVGINQLFVSADRETVELQSFAQVETIGATQMRVTESLEIIDQQKIGRSAKEEPELIQFLVTAR